MFYAHIVLAKKGPLARIWLAAHWDKKLTKAHVFETNIEQSVDGIMQPKVKLALRTSGHLLLGVVRIYSRKAKYLLADCNEAFVKIKMAFRPGMVDLPEEHREAAVNAITLPEVFHDFDTALPELNDVDIEAQFSINQSRADEITMREDYGSMPMSIHDDGFGDLAFDEDTPDLMRDGGVDPNIDENLFAEEQKDIDRAKGAIPGTSRDDDLSALRIADDGFGEEFGTTAVGLFEGDIFGEPAAEEPAQPDAAALQAADEDSDADLGHFDDGGVSPMHSDTGSRPPSALDQAGASSERFRAPSAMPPMSPHGIDAQAPLEEKEEDAAAVADQTTLIHNEEESFALAPVDASAYKGVTKAKRKRKLIVDEVKNISGEEMKSQLANTSDIVTTLDLAPPTKRLMYWKETGGVEKLFALPSRDIPARFLFKNYQRHLSSRAFGVEDFSVLGPSDVLALEQAQEHESPTTATNRRGRKRKLPAIVEQALETPAIPEPEPIREDQSHVSALSLDMGAVAPDDSLMPPPQTPGFEPLRSPGQFPMRPSDPMTPLLPGLPHPQELDIHDDFHHTGLTPAGLQHGGMTPHHGGMTPHHGGMTPHHGGMTPHHGGMTPHHAGIVAHHGGITPQHPYMEHIESIPNLPADQVTSILNEAEQNGAPHDDMPSFEEQHADFGSAKGADTSAEIANDWAEEYEFPQSVGQPQPGEEQQENETDEQFEERVLNKRAAQMFVAVRSRLNKKDPIYLSEMTYKNNRKQAAQKFYSLLVLKKFRALEISQDKSYGDILVTRGPMFDNPKL